MTIHSSFQQVTWGSLSVKKLAEPRITVRELASQTASILLDYMDYEGSGKNTIYYQVEEFDRILKGTRYGNRIFQASGEQQENPELHSLFRALLDAVYSKSGRNDPYSAAALNSYFYFKEEEIRKIITTVEGIRYSLGSSEILTCLAES